MREISSASNSYLKELKSLKSKKYRDRCGKYLIEGEKTVLEALRSPVLVESVVTCDPRSRAAVLAAESGLDVILVPRELILAVADTKTPPDILACIRKQAQSLPETGRLYVVCDAIADPKNLGSIIRTADAVGADGVLVSEDSADVYGPKCQRASMGSSFHLTVAEGSVTDFLRRFSASGGRVVSGILEGSELIADSFERVCLVVGNESRGVSEEVRKLTDIAYRIPIYGRAESLNAAVAAGIMMYDIRRRIEG